MHRCINSSLLFSILFGPNNMLVFSSKQSWQSSFEWSKKGELVLFSPACPSIGQYENYREITSFLCRPFVFSSFIHLGLLHPEGMVYFVRSKVLSEFGNDGSNAPTCNPTKPGGNTQIGSQLQYSPVSNDEAGYATIEAIQNIKIHLSIEMLCLMIFLSIGPQI